MKINILEGFDYGYATLTSKIGPGDYHYHNTYELYFLLKGRSEYFVKDKTYSVEENYIVLIPKNELHNNMYITDKIERYVLNFSEDLITPSLLPVIKSLFKKPIYLPRHPNYLKRLMSDIINEYEKNDAFSAGILQCRLTEILTYVARNPSLLLPDKAEITHPSVAKLTHYMNDNYNKSLTLESAAQMLNMNRSYLSKLFHNNTGFTFKNYLSIIRIKHAKELLTKTNKPITAIAYECGFDDSNYFSTVFKKSEEISPLEYRRKFQI
ncbi:MAG: AraC family transcriptional regulator [bacterium]|nr:AraC family transcriptional regulator [bacterium]